MTAYAGRTYGFKANDNTGYGNWGVGTSFSTPTVTALAANAADFWRQNIDNLIDEPGIAFVNLLLMGDREAEGGTITTRFDGLWGAGRLRARKWDNQGMDFPWAMEYGWTCVGDNEWVILPVNDGNSVPNDVDIIKSAIFWYDERHEIDGTLDDIDLRLEKVSDLSLLGLSDSYDNKERVYYSDPGGTAVQLALYGYNVSADDTLCGANSQRIYYGHFFEDSDRDDPDGPTAARVEPE